VTARRIPYGSEAAAESHLDWLYGQLAAAEARRDRAEAHYAALDTPDQQDIDILDAAGIAADAAAQQVAEIRREIEELKDELWFACPAGREYA
jgi:hypothetical protein